MHVCPACHTPHAAHDSICPSCGLIFASRPSAGADWAGAGVTAPLPQPPAAPPAPPRRAPLATGQRLAQGRYTVQRLISRGGMGAIALASDHDAFGRTVVVKAMLDYFDPASPREAREARELFLQEARTLASLRHPSIPQIFAYFQDGPHNYIVMEYVEGFDLEQGLTRRDERGALQAAGKPYPRDQVLRWGVTLCRILEYLGSRQPPVVHHDIKPANLLLDRNSGEVRLVDFGTARPRPSGGDALASGFGTPGYAPPEQYRGESEPRSDVYALAATLYHLATDDDPRDHPFAFPQLGALGALGHVLEGALALEALRRSSASDLRAELERLLAPAGPPPIEAPDGTALADIPALAAWCERSWALGSAWLYGALPDLLELRWGQTRLARELRECVRQHRGDENAGLDAALALLDPQGFGHASPRLRLSPSRIDFGTFRNESVHSAALTLSNTGRRHLTITLMRPSWVSTVRTLISLPPGQHQMLDLSARPLRGVDPSARHALHFTHAGRRLGEVEVTGRLSFGLRARRALRLRPTTLAAACVVIGMLLVRGLLLADEPRPSALPYRPAPTPPAWRGGLGAYPGAQAASSGGPTAAAVAPPAYPASAPDAAGPFPSPLPLTAGGSLTPLIGNMAVSPDGKWLAIVRGNAAELLRMSDLSSVRNLGQHNQPIYQVIWRPDGKALASVSADGEIKIWGFDDGALLDRFSHGGVPVLAWRPDGGALALTDVNQPSVSLIDLSDRSETALDRPFRAFNLFWTPDGRRLCLVNQDEIAVVDLRQPDVYQTFRVATQQPLLPVVSANTQVLASFSNAVIQIRGTADGALLQTIDFLNQSAPTLALSDDGKLLATGVPDGEVQVWSVESGKHLRVGTSQYPVRMLFSPDKRRLVVLTLEGKLKLLDVPELP